MLFEVTNIKYDASKSVAKNLPKTLQINVPDNLTEYEEIEQFISDKISDETGYCHLGYSTTPEIPEN